MGSIEMSDIVCSVAEDGHILEAPVSMSCGHLICHSCTPQQTIVCLKCGQVNTREVRQSASSESIRRSIEASLDYLIANLNKSIEDELDKYQGLKHETFDIYRNILETVQNEFLVRIESLKTDLENMLDEFNMKFATAVEDVKKGIDVVFQQLDREETFPEPDKTVLANSLENLYQHQRYLKELRKRNEIQKRDLFKISFKIADFQLQPINVGDFNYQFIGISPSHILNTAEIGELEVLCGLKMVGKRLLYRASTHGFDSGAFHRRCDFIAPTLTLIETTNGSVFGGFTTLAWEGNAVYRRDPSAFVFSFKNEQNVREKMRVDAARCENAIYCHPDNGPCFGKMGEIYISSHPGDGNLSFSKFTGTYLTNGRKPNAFFAGSEHFIVKEIEVFSVNELTMQFSK